MPLILDLHTERFVESLVAQGGPPLCTLPAAEARIALETMQARPNEKLAVEVETRTIRGGPTGEVSLRIFRPPGNFSKQPVILYFHGGGWVLGSHSTHDRLLRALVNGARAAVVVVDYARAPEAPHPTALEQAYVAATYIAEHGEGLNLDPSRLAVAGDDAGGNLAAALALMAKERRGPRIRFQALFYPITDAGLDTASYREFADGPWLTRAAMEWSWAAYCPDPAERRKPSLSPLQASIEDLMGLPPALIFTCENDVLRDEGEAYARRLMRAGVLVTAARFLGTIHDFMMLDALAGTPATRGAIAQAGSILQAVLWSPPPPRRP